VHAGRASATGAAPALEAAPAQAQATRPTAAAAEMNTRGFAMARKRKWPTSAPVFSRVFSPAGPAATSWD